MTNYPDCQNCIKNINCPISGYPKTCPEFKEKEINLDLDFQVGDKVYCLIFGNGRITTMYDKSNGNDLKVEMQSGEKILYDKDGILSDDIIGMKRTLFHGHNLKVKINEKDPVRYPWINIIYDPTRNKHITSYKMYNSKEEAVKKMMVLLKEPWIYVDTIQLIPNNLKEK